MNHAPKFDLFSTPPPVRLVAESPVPPIDGVREYLHENSDVLFVVAELPPKSKRTEFIFGRSTRKVFEIMREAGLIACPVDDLIKAETEVFEVGSQPGFCKASIAQLTYSSFVKDGYRFIFQDWDRITRMITLLRVRKLVLIGTQVRKSLTQRSLGRYVNTYGHLGDYVDEGVSVPLYGVALKGGKVADWRLLHREQEP
jgi:hypothetical protein